MITKYSELNLTPGRFILTYPLFILTKLDPLYQAILSLVELESSTAYLSHCLIILIILIFISFSFKLRKFELRLVTLRCILRLL